MIRLNGYLLEGLKCLVEIFSGRHGDLCNRCTATDQSQKNSSDETGESHTSQSRAENFGSTSRLHFSFWPSVRISSIASTEFPKLPR